MAEQITLQQIAELLSAQEARMDQKLAAQTAQVTELLSAQTAQVAEMVDKKLAAQEARMDQKFAAQTVQLEDSMAQSIESGVAINKVSQEQLVDMIVHRVHSLVENVEGRKIESLYDESQAHKATLGDHETRIAELEEAAG